MISGNLNANSVFIISYFDHIEHFNYGVSIYIPYQICTIIIDMGKEYIGNKLRSLRKAKKLSQAELAQKLNLSSWAVASYEQGKSYPSVEGLMKICDIFGVSSDYLLGLSDKLPDKLALNGLNDEEIELILQFIDLVVQNRLPKDKE
ncbi:helix-turn-helix transcriptional regulator [Lactococcus hircilactis]